MIVSELRQGTEFAGFRIESLVARGGMGVVYRATQLALAREVALKFIAPELASQAAFRERFMREARIAASLEHPHVLPVYEVGEVEGELYLAMRLVDGPSLAELLRREGRLEPEPAARLVSQLGEALDAAHRAGLVHRDVKPANVLIARSAHAYLCDFGLSRRTTGASLTKDGSFLGTAAYASPEQIRGEAIDARSDVYALGCLLYECLTGAQPFERDDEIALMWAHMHDPPPEPGDRNRALARFNSVCARALEKEPNDRFASAGDLGRAALGALDGGRARLTERSVATGVAAPQSTPRKRRRLRRGTVMLALAGGSAAGALVAAVAFAIVGFSSGAGEPENPAGRIVGGPVNVPFDPDHLAAGDGRVWALASQGNRLVRFDIESKAVDVFSAGVDLGGGDYADVAVSPRAVWIAHDIPDIGGVDHVDPLTGEAVQHITFPVVAALDAIENAVWAVAPGDSSAPGVDFNGPGKLVRIDPKRDAIVGRAVTVGDDPADVAIGGGAVWVANRGDDSVWRVDPRSRAVNARIAVGDAPGVLAVTRSSVWVANVADRTLMRINPTTNRVEGAPISLGKEIQDVVASSSGLWVSAADGTVTRLDTDTGQVVGTPLTPANAPLSLAFDGVDVWVGSSSDQTLTQIEEGGS